MAKALEMLEQAEDIASSAVPILDEDWLKATLCTSTREYEIEDLPFLYRTPVLHETMDTSLGGHLCLNPPYGFTPGADSYYQGRLKDRVDETPESLDYNIGMGRYYKEAIQDSAEVRTLSLEMCVPEYQNIVSYLMSSTDYVKTIIALEGRSPTYYYAGKALGIYSAFIAFPMITTSFYVLSTLWNATVGLSDPRFYKAKPAMGPFWMTVNNLMQLSAAERGFTRLELMDTSDAEYQGSRVQVGELSSENKHQMHEAMPDIFSASGVIDVMSISSRYQRLLLKKLKANAKVYDADDSSALSVSTIDQLYNKDKGFTVEDLYGTKDKDGNSLTKGVLESMSSFMAKEKKGEVNNFLAGSKPTDEQVTEAGNKALLEEKDFDLDSRGLRKQTDDGNWVEDSLNYFKSAITNTSNAVFLQVDYLGPSSDSFNNTVTDIPLKSMMEPITNNFRNIRFTMGSMDVLGDTVAEFGRKARDVAWGFLDGASFGVTNIIHSVLGGGFVDLPKMWDNSSATIGSHNFKITINPPYGNTASLLMDLDLVLYTLLAAATPKSLGRSSYGSPPLVKAFIPGSVNVDFGMITSLNVTRGSGNISHNVHGAPLSLEIDFTITDFSDIFSMPTNDGFTGAYQMAVDDYQQINKYVRMMAGTSYSDNKFFKRRALKRISALYGGVISTLNPQSLAFIAGSTGLSKTYYNVNDILNSQQSGVWLYNETSAF